jgi:hypothetical protein
MITRAINTYFIREDYHNFFDTAPPESGSEDGTGGRAPRRPLENSPRTSRLDRTNICLVTRFSYNASLVLIRLALIGFSIT